MASNTNNNNTNNNTNNTNNNTNNNTDNETTLQTIINSHIESRQKIYKDIHNNDANPIQISTALGSVFSPHPPSSNTPHPPAPTELRSLINTSLAELSPLARKTKYLEIQEDFNKYYTMTSTNNDAILHTYKEALDTVNKELFKIEKENKDLANEFTAAKRGETTHYRQIKTAKYNMSEHQYYQRLYTLMVAVLIVTLAITIVLGRPILNIVNRQIAIMLLTAVTVLLAMYTIYYVYFNHPSRDTTVFTKYRWSADVNNNGCALTNQNSKPRDDSVEARAAQLAKSAM